MERNLKALAEGEFDLIVIGGGIFGICAAWDAALRGLSVALVEKGDFANATSANHFRMIHGGIRYLQHGDLYRVRESSRERSALLRIAPHLVHPLPIVIPTCGHGMQGKEVLGAGLLLYNMLTFDRNWGIPDSARQIPPGRIISREETLELFPDLKKKDLTGAAIFHDGQTYNPTRLALSFIKSAGAAGAQAANYLEVVGLLMDDERVVGVQVCDLLDGGEFDVHGRIILNAAGPWAAELLATKAGVQLNPQPTFSRDACFIVNRPLMDGYALAVQSQTADPDAIVSRGHRHLFIVPWQDRTLVGVWHVVHEGSPDELTVTETDLLGFLHEINEAYPPLALQIRDISKWMAGLVLFGENQVSKEDLKYGHRSRLIDNLAVNGIDGLITLIGVRFTTARGMAEKAIDLVFHKLGLKAPKSRTSITPIHGGDFDVFDELVQQALRQHAKTVDAETMPPLLHNHGSAYKEVLAYLTEDPCLAEKVGDTRILKAEVIHAIRREMAVKLSDVVFRRTDMGTGGNPGDEALQICASLMAAELGWDPARRRAELEEVRKVFPNL
jgi:glycerol-3-phosphate dehydrogenase